MGKCASINVLKIFAEVQTFVTFVISLVYHSSGEFRPFSKHCNCKTVQPLVNSALRKPMSLSLAFTLEIKLLKKHQNFNFMEKHFFFIKFSNFHRDFIQLSVRIELYGKKFFLHEILVNPGGCNLINFLQVVDQKGYCQQFGFNYKTIAIPLLTT